MFSYLAEKYDQKEIKINFWQSLSSLYFTTRDLYISLPL